MRHEKILKRKDGSKVKIVVKFSCDYIASGPHWEIDVYLCEPGKRIWRQAIDRDSYTFRKLDKQGQAAETLRAALLHISKEEAVGAMSEVWTQLKPPTEIESEQWVRIFYGR